MKTQSETLHSIRLTERYDLSIPPNADGDVKKTLQNACEKYDIWPFRIVKGKKGTAVSLLRNPQYPQYKYTDVMMSFVNHLKLEFAITTIIMVRTPVKVDTTKLPKEIHEIAKENRAEYSEAEGEMLKNLEEDLAAFDSHVVSQTEDSDYDSREAREANKRAIKRKRFEKNCPIIVEAVPLFYSNGKQKTCEGQMALDIGRLMKKG